MPKEMAISRGTCREDNARTILALYANGVSVFILCREGSSCPTSSFGVDDINLPAWRSASHLIGLRQQKVGTATESHAGGASHP